IADGLERAVGQPEVTFAALEQPVVQAVQVFLRFFREADAESHVDLAFLRAFSSRCARLSSTSAASTYPPWPAARSREARPRAMKASCWRRRSTWARTDCSTKLE